MKGIVTFLDGSMNITNTMLIEDKDRLLTTAKNQVDTEEKHVEDANMNLVHIYQSQKANSDSLKLEKHLDGFDRESHRAFHTKATLNF